jgi:hypothetical protein
MEFPYESGEKAAACVALQITVHKRARIHKGLPGWLHSLNQVRTIRTGNGQTIAHKAQHRTGLGVCRQILGRHAGREQQGQSRGIRPE